MKICITSQGDSLDSDIDPRFGRAQYFIIINVETMEFEAIKNPNVDGTGGVGIQSAQLMAGKCAKVVLTGNCGPNAFHTLEAAGIDVITGMSGKVKDVAEEYKSGGFKPAQSPSVDDKFGSSSGK